jgi:hypothetical protein
VKAWLSLSVRDFSSLAPADVAARLAYAQASRHATLELAQRHAWEAQARILRAALRGADLRWRVLFEVDLLRLEKRADVVLLTDRAILVLEFKHGARRHEAADLRQAEDYALDLHDFHAGSRRHPVVPILVATEAPDVPFAPPLIWHGVTTPVLACNAAGLGALIAAVQAGVGAPAQALVAAEWEGAAYRPVPTVLEAATLLYRRNSVAEIAAARADAPNLTRTADAIAQAIARAEAERAHLVVFVTGIPGAGKTLCGLNVVFGALRAHGAAFLSGNVPLVTVLREALARDAAPGGKALQDARRKARTALQNVHRFLEHHVIHGAEVPDARVIVFDEAQRAWDAAQATRDTQRRVSRLTMSEPGHALEIMARHEGWSVIVALIGGGQEINTGEAGLAEWGRVIAADPRWRAVAAPRTVEASDPAQRLADGPRPWLRFDRELDLTVPMRSVRESAGAAWVDAVLRGQVAEAAAIARATDALPFLLTRDLEAMRTGLRRHGRGLRRAGIVAAAGARRLRAEGLGVQVPEVADWFLNRWPDIRSSEALETFATEYDCQGLELDLVGLAWGGDLSVGADGWQPRRFAGDRWFIVRSPEERRFIVNTYRVLMTRARYETILWVPRGSSRDAAFHDATRDAAAMDAIAEFLLDCGARPLEAMAPPPARAEAPTLL